MEIYLMRHGIAVESGTAFYPNDDRPLTEEEGIEKLKIEGKALAKLMIGVDLSSVLHLFVRRIPQKLWLKHSALRAMLQSQKHCYPALTLMRSSHCWKPLRIVSGSFAHHIQPFVSILLGHLTGGPSENFEIKKGSIARLALHRFGAQGGVLKWFLTPRVLGC